MLSFKPNGAILLKMLCIMQSLCGHTSSVESVTFDSAEVLILSGASSGVIKLWDLEEAKSKLISIF